MVPVVFEPANSQFWKFPPLQPNAYAFPLVLLSKQNKVTTSRNVEVAAALAAVDVTLAAAGMAVANASDPSIAIIPSMSLAVFVTIESPFLEARVRRAVSTTASPTSGHAIMVGNRATTSPTPAGRLAGRLAHRLPRAVLVGVDIDPLLLALGRARYGHRVRFIDADVTVAGWTTALTPVRMIDAAVSTTALHWMPPEQPARLYVDLAGVLRPGGVLVNGDHLKLADQALAELAEAAEQGRAERAGVTGNEDWSTWWEAVATEPALAELQARRSERELRHGYGNHLSVDQHVAMLRKAGFTTIGPVWQSGTDHALIARVGTG